MPRISLRTYEQEIEEMIEQNQLKDAVAHCKHILQFFPKNISTYRILGKSFLEAKQYKETSDIFTRVLSVFPDDFIAHAGMSIVRELENDLDAAIWHMQLAFDCQPSNIAIQEELKRLFDLRDGTHPEKIRLTRGALVRMYARGELYQQAIDEIKSALSEEPKRIDLQVFLAKMYFLSGDQEEALAISERLISDFPYCYELNRILVSILKNLGSGKNAEIYAARLIELNPYQAFVNDIYSSEDQVPDEKVVIDKLSDISDVSFSTPSNWSEPEAQWKPPSPIQEVSGTVDTPGTAELKLEPEMDVLSEYPNSATENPQKEETEMSASNIPFTDPAPIGDDSENNIPDWMRNSGWIPSNGEDVPAEENIEPSAPAAETNPADMPDWLKSLSQEGSDAIDADASSEKSDEVPPSPFSETAAWMNNVIAENTPTKDGDESDLPDWLKNFETDDKVEPVAKDDLPDWLNALKADGNAASAVANPFQTEPQSEVPSTEESVAPLHDGEEEVDPLANLFAKDASAWQPAEELLKDNPAAEQPETEPQMIPGQVEDVAETTQEVTTEVETVDSNATISQETENDLLSWLRDLKPTDAEENVSPVAETVPEESLDNEDQRYDFAAQLERLQNMNEEPVAQQQTVETPIAEKAEEGLLEPIETSVVLESVPTESEAVEPVSSSLGAEPSISEETPSFEAEAETPAPQEPSDLPTWESQPDNSLVEESEQPTPEQTLPELEILRREADANPDDFYAWQNLGDAYAKAGNLVDALTAYEKAESILTKSN